MAAFATLFAWWRNRTRNSLVAVGLMATLLVALVACDWLFESSREEAVRRIQLLEEAANARRFSAVAEQLAPEFRFRSLDSPAFIRFATNASTQYNATIHFTAFDRGEAVYLPDDAIRIGFVGQVESPQLPQQRGACYVEATFAPGADGKLKITRVEVFEYISRATTQAIPGL